MVGVNFGETTVVNTEEEFKQEVEKRKMKKPDKVSQKLKDMLSDKKREEL